MTLILNSAGRLLVLASVAVLAILAAGCLPATSEKPSYFSPRPATYNSDQLVYINIPQANQIFYTLDGTKPEANCLEYNGSPILLNLAVNKIRVMYTNKGQEIEITEKGLFNILNPTGGGGGGGGGNANTNSQMLLDWIDQETVLSRLLQKHNNCGFEPVSGSGCDTGPIPKFDGLDELWWICDNYDPVSGSGYTDGSFSSHRNAPSGSLNLCKSEGHGWVTWMTTIDGNAIFKFFNFKLTQDLVDSLGAVTLPSGVSTATGETIAMSVTGGITGVYGTDPAGNGTTNTVPFNHFSPCSQDPMDPNLPQCDNSSHLKVSGSYTGEIEDDITMKLKKKASGSFSVYCSDAGCNTVPDLFLAPNWSKFEVIGEASCAVSWFRMESQSQDRFKCLEATYPNGGFLQMKTCAGEENDKQKWRFVHATANETENLWLVQPASDSSQCLTAWKDPKDVFEVNPWWFKVQKCAAANADPLQHMSLSGLDRKVRIKIPSINMCAINFWGPVNQLNINKCGDSGFNTEFLALYKDGLHPPEYNPAAFLLE